MKMLGLCTLRTNSSGAKLGIWRLDSIEIVRHASHDTRQKGSAASQLKFLLLPTAKGLDFSAARRTIGGCRRSAVIKCKRVH